MKEKMLCDLFFNLMQTNVRFESADLLTSIGKMPDYIDWPNEGLNEVKCILDTSCIVLIILFWKAEPVNKALRLRKLSESSSLYLQGVICFKQVPRYNISLKYFLAIPFSNSIAFPISMSVPSFREVSQIPIVANHTSL